MENLTLGPRPEIDLSNVLEAAEPIALPSTIEKFVVFQVGDEFFGVPALAVKEVAPPMPVAPLPSSPSWLQGLSNLRGEIVAMINFPFRRGAARPSPKARALVLNSPQWDMPIGFVTDKIAEIVSVESNSIRPSDDPSLRGLADLNSTSVKLIDSDRMLGSLIG